jgi:hypothetical protein
VLTHEAFVKKNSEKKITEEEKYKREKKANDDLNKELDQLKIDNISLEKQL